MKQRTGTNYSHISLAFLSPHGLDAVIALHDKEPLSHDCVKNAIKYLKGAGHDTERLVQWSAATFGGTKNTLGIGEVKKIKIQEHSTKASVHIRVGLDKAVFKAGEEISLQRTGERSYTLG